MTGSGRSPSSPMVQSAHGHSFDDRGTQTLHPGLPSSNAVFEQASPNYFGITVQNAHDSPNSNQGQHVQKNWSSLSRVQSSLPSPKLQLYSQESVSEGLANLLKTESGLDKGRRETAFQRGTSNGAAHTPKMDGGTRFSTQGVLGEHGPTGGRSPGPSSQGSSCCSWRAFNTSRIKLKVIY